MTYAIGVDFGTESGRTVLVDVRDGREVATAVYAYANGVIDNVLPSTGGSLPPEWALQDPDDYIGTFTHTIPQVLAQANIKADDVIGIGIDFTACTMVAADAQGRALCQLPEWRSEPHAWVKLWKHHAAQPEADDVNRVARERGENFLERYGGKISSEWMFPKILQTLREAPQVYAAAARFMEAADWVILQLTGQERRNACTAGYKALWHKAEGYPPPEYFAALDPRLRDVVTDKLSTTIYPPGVRAGGLVAEMAEQLGLNAGTAVAVANVDAHVSVPACTVVEPAKMVMVMGTSICHMVLGTEQRIVPGMCGVVEDGILPGYFGYEAGQSAVGDIFAWFVDNAVPSEYRDNGDVHSELAERAARLRPGESGLLALDWWNGNRSVLVDVDLSGLLIGMTLRTRAEEIYRALIEATAFGTNVIVRNFRDHGVPIEELYACGGLPERSPLLMQIYADVCDMPIRVSASGQTPALGSAMFAAVAAGAHATIVEAARAMARVKAEVYRPDPRAHEVYERLYSEYVRLHDFFGREVGESAVMKRLLAIRDDVRL
ncbi:MAG: ribulokinase [Chloroflexi bacterium]|nr:ribulokinase [Chloroflexota bacterium]MBV9894643.1 ribulokinase [Chloroflexota bacterium]